MDRYMETSLTADALPVSQNITALLNGLLNLERREEDLQEVINSLLHYGLEASGREVQMLVDIISVVLPQINQGRRVERLYGLGTL
jgi:predicted component of type VI protein secretion system